MCSFTSFGKQLRGFGGLGWSRSLCPHLALIPAFVWHCVVLHVPYQGCLSWKSAALPTHGPRLQPHLVRSQGVNTGSPCLLAQTILGWLHGYPAIVFWDIHIPWSSGILHSVSLLSLLQRSPTDFHLLDHLLLPPSLFVLPPCFLWVLNFLVAHSSSSLIEEYCWLHLLPGNCSSSFFLSLR